MKNNMNNKIETLQPEDLVKLKFLQDAQISPNEKYVVYTIASINKNKNEISSIWLKSIETGETKQLTTGLYLDSNPRWSPDNKKIAFISNRNNKTQLYLFSVDEEKEIFLTGDDLFITSYPAWSCDGKHIAFTASSPLETNCSSQKFVRLDIIDNIVSFR